MENIAHALCGAAIADAAFEKRLSRPVALTTSVIAANFPDIDLALYPIAGADHYMMWHRGITHSLAAAAVVPIVLALVIWLVTRRRADFKALWLLATLGYLSHLAMDVITSWGTMLLLPFSDARFSTHWVFVADLFFWVILSLPWWLPRIVSIRRDVTARFSLGLLMGYVGLCAGMHALAVERTANAAEQLDLDAEISVYPGPFLPVYWNGVAATDELIYQGRVQSVGGDETQLAEVRARNFEHAAVKAVLASEVGSRFAHWWASVPFAEVRCLSRDHVFVLLSDVKFLNPWLESPGFKVAFEVTWDKQAAAWSVERSFWLTWATGNDLPEAACSFAPVAQP